MKVRSYKCMNLQQGQCEIQLLFCNCQLKKSNAKSGREVFYKVNDSFFFKQRRCEKDTSGPLSFTLKSKVAFLLF